MNIEKTLNQIGEIYSPLSNECLQEFIAKSKVRTFKRGDIVVREGQFSEKAYLIIQGCARANYIQIKNHLLWWSMKTYRIRDIREILFEVPFRGASGIKIMTKDFNTMTCLAATLKTKDFEELKATFAKLNIKYRGEFE